MEKVYESFQQAFHKPFDISPFINLSHESFQCSKPEYLKDARLRLNGSNIPVADRLRDY